MPRPPERSAGMLLELVCAYMPDALCIILSTGLAEALVTAFCQIVLSERRTHHDFRILVPIMVNNIPEADLGPITGQQPHLARYNLFRLYEPTPRT